MPCVRRAAAAESWLAVVSGRFIVIEGPNGVGKTTTSHLLIEQLQARRGRRMHWTTEPSRTPLGRLLRSGEADLPPRALALAIAADRLAHVEGEIEPRVRRGEWVISDRYVQSSLVLQRIDGIVLDEIWGYNAAVRRPDATFYLEAEPETLRARLDQRPQRSRLEQLGSPERELALYREAATFLASLGWRQHVIDCIDRTPSQVVEAILSDLETVDASQ